MRSKINFRKLNLKSHEEYLICKTFVKDLIFKLNCQVEKGERNDKITGKSKSKALTEFLNVFFARISQEEYDDGDGWKADHFYSEEDHSTIAEEVNKLVFCT